MKVTTKAGWYNGESLKLLPSIEIYNNSDNIFISFGWMKFCWDIGLESTSN